MKTFNISGNIWEPSDILALRRRLELTQLQFGRLMMVTPSAVWLWEHGQRVPELGTLVVLDGLAKEASDEH